MQRDVLFILLGRHVVSPNKSLERTRFASHSRIVVDDIPESGYVRHGDKTMEAR